MPTDLNLDDSGSAAATAPDQRTLVTFLLDESGSMDSIQHDTMAGFNSYVDTLKTSGAGLIDFTFVLFDTTKFQKVCLAVPVEQVPLLDRDNYKPNGGTPLVDAAYKTIKAVEASLAGRAKQPKVVITIQTDGQENSSTEHIGPPGSPMMHLHALIKEKTALGWQFNFLGAGIDAYGAAQDMGIHAAATMSYDRNNSRQTFAAHAGSTMRYASGASADTSYSIPEKMSAGDSFAHANDPRMAGLLAKKGVPLTTGGPAVGGPSKPPVTQQAKAILDDITL